MNFFNELSFQSQHGTLISLFRIIRCPFLDTFSNRAQREELAAKQREEERFRARLRHPVRDPSKPLKPRRMVRTAKLAPSSSDGDIPASIYSQKQLFGHDVGLYGEEDGATYHSEDEVRPLE